MQFGIWYVCDMNKWKECYFTQTHATHTMLLVNNLLSLIWTRISSALTHLQLAASASCLSTQSPRCYRRGRVCAEVWPPVAGLLRPDFCHCKSAAAQAARSPSGGSDLRAWWRGPGAGWQRPAVPWAGTWPSGSASALPFSRRPFCASRAWKARPSSSPPLLGAIALEVAVPLRPPAQKVTTVHSITCSPSKG